MFLIFFHNFHVLGEVRLRFGNISARPPALVSGIEFTLILLLAKFQFYGHFSTNAFFDEIKKIVS